MNENGDLTITLGGKDEHLTVNNFIDVIGGTFDILNKVEMLMSGLDEPQINWEIIEIYQNPPVTLIVNGIQRKKNFVAPHKITATFHKAMRTVNRQARKPKIFDEYLLNKTKQLVNPLRGEMDFIEYGTKEDKPVRLSKKMVDNIDRLTSDRTPFYTIESCHEGLLKIYNIYGRKPEYHIFDTITKEKIRCYFNKDQINEIFSHSSKKIRVFGETKFRRKDHKPVSIEVKEFIPQKDKSELPQLADLHALQINITNGMNSEDYIEELRNAE